jgi:hypothetical protein
MSINKQTVASSFERACVSLQRGTGVLLGSSGCCGTAGARIELTPDESGVTV